VLCSRVPLYQPMYSTTARGAMARVDQVCRSMSSPLSEAKNDSERALSQHWPVRSCDSVTAILRSDRWTVSGRARGERSLERQFAEAFAAYCGSRHGVATDHGSSSLVLAIESLGLPVGPRSLCRP
jgi:hypothetical protein